VVPLPPEPTPVTQFICSATMGPPCWLAALDTEVVASPALDRANAKLSTTSVLTLEENIGGLT
jgi:hypothetical protein